jgi:hypothetical protein
MVYLKSRYWWYIYAPFAPANEEEEEETAQRPHTGQVVRYYRALRKETLQEVAETVGHAPEEIEYLEGSAAFPDTLLLRIALTRHLDIPPRLMHLSSEIFEPKESELPTLMTSEELEALGTSSLSLEEKGNRFLEDVEAFKQLVVMRNTPLAKETLEVYEMGLEACMQQFALDAIKRARAQAARKKLAPTITDKIQALKALDQLNFWCQKIRGKMEYSKWYRYDQLLHILYHFYEAVNAIDDTLHGYLFYVCIPPFEVNKALDQAIACAQQLGNAENTAKSLFYRGRLPLRFREYPEAYKDIEAMLFYFQVLCDTFDEPSTVIEFTFKLASTIRTYLLKSRKKQEFCALLDRAYNIANIQEELRYANWSEEHLPYHAHEKR